MSDAKPEPTAVVATANTTPLQTVEIEKTVVEQTPQTAEIEKTVEQTKVVIKAEPDAQPDAQPAMEDKPETAEADSKADTSEPKDELQNEPNEPDVVMTETADATPEKPATQPEAVPERVADAEATDAAAETETIETDKTDKTIETTETDKTTETTETVAPVTEKETTTEKTVTTTEKETTTAKTAAPATEKETTTEKTATTVYDDVPDPDEDDLDDLDDLLDDFSTTQIDSKAPPAPAAPATSKADPAAGLLGLEDDLDDEKLEALLNDDDFAKQLQAGMADLLGGMGGMGGSGLDQSPDVQAQFESLFKEFSDAAGPSGPSGPSSATKEKADAPTNAPSDASFQDTIRRTMERMQASGDQATAAAAADSENADDLLSEFMKQMQSGGLGGAGSEEELSKMLVGMMEELTNKEILYEPMKELHDKFPAWMAANAATTPAADLARYQEQQAVVREIVARFEQPSYADTNPEDREYIVDRMQRMQSAGSPPADLVGDMPSAQEALAVPDDSCPTQ